MARVPVRRNDDGSIWLSYDFWEIVDGVPVRFMFSESDERLVCTRLEIGAPFDDPEEKGLDPRPVTTELLRRIPVARMIDARLLKLVRDVRRLGPPISDLDQATSDFADRAEVSAKSAKSAKRPGAPLRYGDDHYEKVMRVYEGHGGSAKRQAVAKAFYLSPSTASKHIAEAKRRRKERERG
jgi:hypothetical protein